MDLELFWYFRWSLSTVTKSKSYVTGQLTPNYLYNIFWAWWEWDRSLCKSYFADDVFFVPFKV